MGTDSPEVIRRPAKYIFLDVVQFSMRTAEDQSRIVHRLNSIVRESLGSHGIKEEDRILIPTGDGMCIALIGLHQYDVHVRFALSILKSLHNYNEATAERARRFQIRIGINQNTDILVQDINNRTNIAGAGINDASRVMGQAD